MEPIAEQNASVPTCALTLYDKVFILGDHATGRVTIDIPNLDASIQVHNPRDQRFPGPVLHTAKIMRFQNVPETGSQLPSVPAIFEGGAREWPAFGKWKLDFFQQVYGEKVVAVLPDEQGARPSMVKLGEYIATFDQVCQMGGNDPGARPNYLRGWRFEEWVSLLTMNNIANRIL